MEKLVEKAVDAGIDSYKHEEVINTRAGAPMTGFYGATDNL